MKNTCGTCTLCCKTVPVAELNLRAFQCCPHERNAPFATPGCAIYPERPRSCREWVCHYLSSDWPADMRPDRCGVVVDVVMDFCRVIDGETGERRELPCVQMWAAPGFESAFERQPVLAAVLAVLDQGKAVLWRYRGPDGGTLARSLFRDADGEMVATQPAPPVEGYSAETTRERLLRATTAFGIEDMPFSARRDDGRPSSRRGR